MTFRLLKSNFTAGNS